MTIHQVEGRDLRDALVRAFEEHGADALVLSHRAIRSGGVTLAVVDERPKDFRTLTRMRGEARDLLSKAPAALEAGGARPATTDLERRMLGTGTSQALVTRISGAVRARSDEGLHPLDQAGAEIGALFDVARSPSSAGQTVVHALVGPTGVGKTTSAAKLAARWARAGKRVLLTTFDVHRVGAVEALRAWGACVGVATAAARTGSRLANLASGENAPEVVLVDGSGDAQKDLVELERLERITGERSLPLRLERHLILSAAHDEESLARAASLAAYDGCGITKLDETRRPARVLELALDLKLPVAFLSDGADLSHLYKPTPDRFADLMLRGRLS